MPTKHYLSNPNSNQRCKRYSQNLDQVNLRKTVNFILFCLLCQPEWVLLFLSPDVRQTGV